MPQKHRYICSITRLTNKGSRIYGGCEDFRGEAEFTPSYHHCAFNGIVLEKIKGGRSGANYQGVEDKEDYMVMKFKRVH